MADGFSDSSGAVFAREQTRCLLDMGFMNDEVQAIFRVAIPTICVAAAEKAVWLFGTNEDDRRALLDSAEMIVEGALKVLEKESRLSECERIRRACDALDFLDFGEVPSVAMKGIFNFQAYLRGVLAALNTWSLAHDRVRLIEDEKREPARQAG